MDRDKRNKKKIQYFFGKMRQDSYHRKHLISEDRKGYPESADVLNIYIRCA